MQVAKVLDRAMPVGTEGRILSKEVVTDLVVVRGPLFGEPRPPELQSWVQKEGCLRARGVHRTGADRHDPG